MNDLLTNTRVRMCQKVFYRTVKDRERSICIKSLTHTPKKQTLKEIGDVRDNPG